MKSRIFLAAFLVLAWVPAAFAAAGRLEHVRGPVMIQKKGQEWKPAENGDALEAGDKVKTGAKASVLLHLKKADLSLYDESEFEVKSYDAGDEAMQAHLNLLIGRLQARVQKLGAKDKLEIKTPTNVAAVRGTVFDLWVFMFEGEIFTRISTTEGSVFFCSQGGAKCIEVRDRQSAVGDAENVREPLNDEDAYEVEPVSPAEVFQDQDGFGQEADHAQENFSSLFAPPPVQKSGGSESEGGGT